MKRRLLLGVPLAALLAGSVLAAGGLTSGPPVGSHRLLPFNPLNVTGDNAGEKVCQV
jgi:hypothetical protein